MSDREIADRMAANEHASKLIELLKLDLNLDANTEGDYSGSLRSWLKILRAEIDRALDEPMIQ